MDDLKNTTPMDRTLNENRTPFESSAAYWDSIGFSVIPGTRPSPTSKGKEPLIKFSGIRGGRPRDLHLDWVREDGQPVHAADSTPLLLTGSGDDWDLVVVDDDSGRPGDDSAARWIEQEYGASPFRVSTGRDGGGTHHFYRLPKGIKVTSSTKLIHPDLDVKSSQSFVVAAGALHQTGRFYSVVGIPDWETRCTKEWWEANVPMFNPAKYAMQYEAGLQARRARPSVAKVAGGGQVTTSGDRLDPRVEIPGTGMPVSEFVSQLALGGKIPVCCPFHDDRSPSAVLYAPEVAGGRYRIFCSSCTQTWVSGSPTSDVALSGIFTFDGEVSTQGVTESALKDHHKAVSVTPPEKSDLDARMEELWAQIELEESGVWTPTEQQIEEREYDQYLAAKIKSAKAKPAYVANLPRGKSPEPFAGGLVEGAQEAFARSQSATHAMRRGWVDAGVLHGDYCHSIRQVLRDHRDGSKKIHPRRCDKMACRNCGPLNAEMKAFAAIYLPLVEDGIRVGSPLRERPVYAHVVPEADLKRWVGRYRQRLLRKKRRGVTESALKDHHKAESVTEDAHAYVIFAPATEDALILSTLDLGGSRVASDDLEPLVAMAAAWTYRPILPTAELLVEGLDGLPMEPTTNPTLVVTGKITSSHNLRLDPDAILTLSRGSHYRVQSDDVAEMERAQQVVRDFGLLKGTRYLPTDDETPVIAGIDVQCPADEDDDALLIEALRPGAPSVAELFARRADERSRAPAPTPAAPLTNDEMQALLESALG